MNTDQTKVTYTDQSWFDIAQDVMLGLYRPPQRNADGSLKHVICEGSRQHVLWYSTNGQHCSEPECEINRQPW